MTEGIVSASDSAASGSLFKDGFIKIEGLIRRRIEGEQWVMEPSASHFRVKRSVGFDFRSNEEVVLVEGVIDALSMIILTGRERALVRVSIMRRVIESDLRLEEDQNTGR